MGQYYVIAYNAEQNAAANAAETVWSVAEAFTHYFVIPYGYQTMKMTYQGLKWLVGGCAAAPAPVAPPPAPVQQPGWFRWAWNGITSVPRAAASVAKIAWKLGYPQVISHSLNQLWLKEKFWDKFRPLAVAFWRAPMEKFLPQFYQIWDKGDINLSGREFVPGGPGTWLSWAAYPLIKIKVVGEQLFFGQTIVSVNEQFAYQLGESFADTAEALLTTASDTLKGTRHIGPCMMNGLNATGQCLSDAGAYYSDRFSFLNTVSKPLQEAGKLWAKEGWNFLNAYSGQAFNIVNLGLWGTAKFVENQTHIPAHLVYYAEVAGLVYVGYKSVGAAKRLAGHLIYAHLLPAGVNVQQRLFNLWPGYQQPQALPGPALPPQPQPQPQVLAAPGVVVHNHNIQNNGAQAPAAQLPQQQLAVNPNPLRM